MRGEKNEHSWIYDVRGKIYPFKIHPILTSVTISFKVKKKIPDSGVPRSVLIELFYNEEEQCGGQNCMHSSSAFFKLAYKNIPINNWTNNLFLDYKIKIMRLKQIPVVFNRQLRDD